MKEIKLKPREYDIIADMASDKFRNNPVRFDGGNFLAQCYLEAILAYCCKHKLNIINGKLVKNEE